MIISQGLVLLLVSLVGMYFASLYGRRIKRFRWVEYVLLLATPIVASLSLSYSYGVKIFYLFIASAIVGFILEYALGRIYHITLNRRLWFYQKYNVAGGYTSYLTIPIWGVAGIIFWLLSQSVGL